MKVTQSAKEKTKLKILNAAVDLITIKGFENASLREIAKSAGVSNPTIYNYFPTKQKLLYAYIEQKHKEAIEAISKIEGFDNFSFREQLQSLIESELELYLEDREFVAQIADMVFSNSGLKINLLYDTNKEFIEVVKEMLEVAIEANEFEPIPFSEHLPLLLWDYYIMVVSYWLKDDSENFENTTEFIDHSLALIESILHSDIISKASTLGSFLFKRHILSSLNKFTSTKSHFDGIKKRLTKVFDNE